MKVANEKHNQNNEKDTQRSRYVEKLYDLLIKGYITKEELKDLLNK